MVRVCGNPAARSKRPVVGQSGRNGAGMIDQGGTGWPQYQAGQNNGYPFRQPYPPRPLTGWSIAALAAGLLLAGAWVLFSLGATLVTSDGYTMSEVHGLCGNALVAVLGGRSCSRLNEYYNLAGVAFWLAVVLLAGFAVVAVLRFRQGSRP